MHDIEPYYRWLDHYDASHDDRSPFFGKAYNYELYTETIYGYYIDPAWDFMGSETLYVKLLYVDYDHGYAVIQLIGEWNDAINNDIMHLKRNVIDSLSNNGINKYILLGDHIFNFHGSDDEYYAEWFDDVEDTKVLGLPGWVAGISFPDFIKDELGQFNIDSYINLGGQLDIKNWRTVPPTQFCQFVNNIIQKRLN